MKSTISYFFFLLFMGLSLHSWAQESQRINLMFSYGADLPFADMDDRYGINYNPGIDIEFVKNSKWFYGIHGHMLLGPIVNEDPISNIRNSDGLLVSQQQDLAVITLKERGFIVGLHAGRFINFSQNPNILHGLRLRAGAGILTHYIIFNNETNSTNQLLGEYEKGYNRLTRGWEVEQFIGYQYQNKKGNLNLYGGFNFVEGFTKNLRPVDFDTRVRNDEPRLDILLGFRVGFAIKLYDVKSSEEEVFY